MLRKSVAVAALVVVALMTLSILTAEGAPAPDLAQDDDRPSVTPPPKGSPTPTFTPDVEGGLIELYPYFDPTWQEEVAGWHTLVQWKDGLGYWHDVETWRGGLDEIHDDWGRKSWWVDPEDFNKGPFRWVVYYDTGTWVTPPESAFLIISQEFYLPCCNGHVVRVREWLDE